MLEVVFIICLPCKCGLISDFLHLFPTTCRHLLSFRPATDETRATHKQATPRACQACQRPSRTERQTKKSGRKWMKNTRLESWSKLKNARRLRASPQRKDRRRTPRPSTLPQIQGSPYHCTLCSQWHRPLHPFARRVHRSKRLQRLHLRVILHWAGDPSQKSGQKAVRLTRSFHRAELCEK